MDLKKKQDGRLTPAYFSPNYKYFDQLLQTVKNKTTVLILIFRVFTNINSTTDFWTLCKRVSWFSVEKFSSHSAKKFRRGTLQSITNFRYRKMLRINRKIIWHDRDSNLKPSAWQRCCPNHCCHFFLNKKWAISGLKKEKRPHWMNSFSCVLHMRRKIINYIFISRPPNVMVSALKSTGLRPSSSR